MTPDAHQTNATPPDDGTWLRTLKKEVEPTTFKLGREYAESRRVLEVAREGRGLRALVSGTAGARYHVEVEPSEDGGLESRCTCEAHQSGEGASHCKHVVAGALIYLARLRPMLLAAAAARAEANRKADDGDASGESSSEGAVEEVEVSAGPGPDVAPLPALAKLESWLGLSSQPDHEYLYRISAAGAGTGRQWVMDVRRMDAQGKGPVHVKRALQAASRMAPLDEQIFQALSAHEARYDSKLVISDEDLADLLPLLRSRKVIYRGTPLLQSDAPATPQVRLESRADAAIVHLEVRLPNGETHPLKDVVLVAGRRATWIFVAQDAYPLEPAFPPRILRKWLLEPTMAFPHTQVDRVLTFFAAHLPRFQMGLQADDIQVEEGVAPQFVLTLDGGPDKVRAVLAARYGQTTMPVNPATLHLGFASGAGARGRSLYRRDEVAERDAAKRLQDLGLRHDPSSGSFDASGDAALEFWARGLAKLPKEWERFGVQAPKLRLRSKLRPRIRVSMSGVQWFELDAGFESEDQQLDLGAVRMWLESGRRFIALRDGTFAEADREELQRAADLLEEAGALPGKRKTQLPLSQAVALDLLTELGEFTEIEEQAMTAMREVRATGGIPQIDAPKGLQATLRHYQQAGLSWGWFLHRHGLGGILADDMGLGKTLQALSLMLQVKREQGHKPSLVVAPTSVLANWEREAERFTPEFKVVVWHGPDRKSYAEELKSADLVLTSYALVRRDLEALSEVNFRYVVLDEAQNIKNADSATAQACKSIPSDHRLALTGTPLENRLSELWSLFDFLMPGFLGTSDSFHERFEQPIQVAGDAAVRERLRARIQPFIMRRLKTEVAKDLPPKTETVAWCEMEAGQAALYREVLDESRRKVFDSIEKVGFKRSRVSILAALMKLRQVCCDPRLLKMPPGTALPGSAKLERFGGLVEDLVAEGHRALVFSQFTEMLELLTQSAKKMGFEYSYLDGRTRDRMARVDAFNAPDGPPLFFISLKAGGTGLNLTAADYVIHYDPWWNPAVEDQATDRTHRIGQTRAVFAYKLITRGTVEEKILALQRRKKELAAGVLGGDSDVGRVLTEQDVEDLFRME